ncbi:MAG: ABC transporter permease subunit [Firmicutes bacterium]|nr:ABC transporter permease subunit [Bacillota bacterium]MDY2920503.1 ABC transporter permease subunit [Lentihominibacter sp.]
MKSEIKSEARDQIIFVICFIGAWYVVYKMQVFNEKIFPSPGQIGEAFIKGFTENGLLAYTAYSMTLIVKGLAVGIGLAFVFSSIAVVSRHFRAIYNFIVSVCDLLPGVALLPLAICWFGVNEITIIFIVVHSIIWPMSRSLMDGFRSIPAIYIEGGKNIGLKGMKLVTGVYLPAAFASVLSGLRVGWARAWRGLISVEMIFGTTGKGAGIGWYIFMRRVNVDIAGVFASLIVIIIIGVIIEYGIFRVLERNTVKKWGMAQ